MKRIAVVVSHPIQHFCPQYRSWAATGAAHLKVFFGSSRGVEPYFDTGFGTSISWGTGLLDGFESLFLSGGLSSGPHTPLPLADALEDFKPDLVVVYGYSQSIQRSAIAWCLRTRTKMAYIADSELRQAQGAVRRVGKRAVLSALFKHIGVFLTVGDANEEYYRYMGVHDEKMLRMHFPIDLRAYDTAFSNRDELRARKRSELGLGPSAVGVLMVGKVTARKRQSDLIAAGKEARLRIPELRVLVAGVGPNYDECRRACSASSAADMLGFIQPDDLPSIYAASDIYAHVSDADPHPLAISEAAALGLPLIASRAVGSWGETDDLLPFRNGLVFETGSIRQLTDALVLLGGDRRVREKMGSESRLRSAGFQARAHATAFRELVERI